MSSIPSGLNIEKFSWYQMLAVVSGVILIFSLFYPVQGFENRYITSIASGFLLFAITEWSEWGIIMSFRRSGILTYPAKRRAWYHVLLKIIASIFIIISLLKLIFSVDIIGFFQ